MLNSWPLAKDLQVLVEIVHSGSFSAAAATLGQTPAFVTKRIQILENTLATTLLNRSARGVALTESGQRCYEHALEILTQYQRLVDDVTQIKTRPEGMIRIGGNDSNLLIVFYVQIMPDDFVMQLHRF